MDDVDAVWLHLMLSEACRVAKSHWVIAVPFCHQFRIVFIVIREQCNVAAQAAHRRPRPKSLVVQD
jgi:hypothetical protein